MAMEKRIPAFNALILAAGRGSRMRALTDRQPKCLTKLAGKPLLDWQLSSLREGGAATCTVMAGYLGHMLQGDFITDIYPRWAETNMVGTLAWGMRTPLQTDCIVSYSDIVYKTDHVRSLALCPQDIAITYDTRWLELWRLRFSDPLADAETFIQKDDLLQTIGQKALSTDEIQGQYMGLIKIRPNGWEAIAQYLSSLPNEAADKLDMTSLLRALLENGINIGAVPVTGGWCEVDNEHDAAVYETALAQGGWSHDWR